MHQSFQTMTSSTFAVSFPGVIDSAFSLGDDSNLPILTQRRRFQINLQICFQQEIDFTQHRASAILKSYFIWMSHRC